MDRLRHQLPRHLPDGSSAADGGHADDHAADDVHDGVGGDGDDMSAGYSHMDGDGSKTLLYLPLNLFYFHHINVHLVNCFLIGIALKT